MSKTVDVAIVGATGVVGETLLEMLEQQESIGKLFLLASDQSLGKVMYFKERSLKLQDVEQFDFSKAEVVIFAASSAVSEAKVQKALDAGCFVVDASDYSRRMPQIPLLVEGVNLEAMNDRRHVAVPSSLACIAAQVLAPLAKKPGLLRADIVSFEAISGIGRDAVEELVKQTVHMMSGKGRQDAPRQVLEATIGFNVVPQGAGVGVQAAAELRKVLDAPQLPVLATSALVPVIYGSSIAFHLQTATAVDPETLKAVYADSRQINLDSASFTAADEAAGNDDIYLQWGQAASEDPSHISLWCAVDNIRRGVAANLLAILNTYVSNAAAKAE